METLRFDGRVVAVTGAGRGLGREYAKLLAARGACVIVNDLGVTTDGTAPSADPSAEVVTEIRAAGGKAVANSADVADPDGAFSIVDAAISTFGRLDVIVNNAGIVRPLHFEETPRSRYEEQLRVSFFGSLNLVQAAWPELKKTRGNVISVSSSALLGVEVLAAYAAGKGAVYAFSRCLALSGRPHGIRVNTVFPMAATRMADASADTIATEELKRFVDRELAPAKVAPLVAFLAHENCPVSGCAFNAGRDRVAKVFVGETLGFRQPSLSVEDIASNWDRICDSTQVFDFASNDEMLSFVMGLV
jgi:NAD(P)-dependent dehydrogenase (short-subunit alcohol dehydrogenase family)